MEGFSAHTYKRIANISDFEGILKIIKTAKHKWGMHIEIITNLTPGFNDDIEELNEMADWIVNELGHETPWRITRFVPHFGLSDLLYTPISKLEQARDIGMDKGLKYVYLGNVPGHPAENTYCPRCGELLIKRDNYQILEHSLKGNKCEYCNQAMAGYFE